MCGELLFQGPSSSIRPTIFYRSLRTPSPVDPTLITPRPNMTSLPTVPLSQAAPVVPGGSLTMMQRLQQDRRRQLEEYKARQQQEGINYY